MRKLFLTLAVSTVLVGSVSFAKSPHEASLEAASQAETVLEKPKRRGGVRGLWDRITGKNRRSRTPSAPAPVVESAKTDSVELAHEIEGEKIAESKLMDDDASMAKPLGRKKLPLGKSVKRASDGAESSAEEDSVYIVQPKDTLLSISRKTYGTPKYFGKIKEWNNLSTDSLRSGQKLTLKAIDPVMAEESSEKPRPAKKAPKAVKNPEKTPAPVSAAPVRVEDLFPADQYRFKVYRVAAGDTLAKIAQTHLGSASKASALAALNEMDPQTALAPNQKVIIPVKK